MKKKIDFPPYTKADEKARFVERYHLPTEPIGD